MEHIRGAILNCLQSSEGSDAELIVSLNRIVEDHGREVYPVLLHVLTHLEMEIDEARHCWREIAAHREAMTEALGREINLRTAICDYFCSIHRSLRNPKVVEIHVFERQASAYKFDRLTGLYTRAFFDEEFVREIARARRYSFETSVLFLDIDDFKAVNDTYGHLVGDLALKHVSRIIMEQIRTTDTAARYGGEEIVVVLPETGKVNALLVGERIRSNLADSPLVHEGEVIRITISGGLATCPIDESEPQRLLESADEALYRAKRAGKNRITLFSENRRRHIRLALMADMEIIPLETDNGGGPVRGRSRDLSTTGMLFSTDAPLAVGGKVQIIIRVEPETEKPLMLIGKVVRTEMGPTGEVDVGVSFIDVENGLKATISEFMERAHADEDPPLFPAGGGAP